MRGYGDPSGAPPAGVREGMIGPTQHSTAQYSTHNTARTTAAAAQQACLHTRRHADTLTLTHRRTSRIHHCHFRFSPCHAQQHSLPLIPTLPSLLSPHTHHRQTGRQAGREMTNFLQTALPCRYPPCWLTPVTPFPALFPTHAQSRLPRHVSRLSGATRRPSRSAGGAGTSMCSTPCLASGCASHTKSHDISALREGSAEQHSTAFWPAKRRK